MKKLLVLSLLFTAFASGSNAHASCKPIAVSVAVGDFNVTLGSICNNDDSISYSIATTSLKGKIVQVTPSDTDALSGNDISPGAWNACLSKASTQGLSGNQRATVEIAAQSADDSDATMDDAKYALAEVCLSANQ